MPSWRWKKYILNEKEPDQFEYPTAARYQATRRVGQEAGCCQEGKTGFRPIGIRPRCASQGTGAPRCALTKGSGCAAGTQVWQQ